MPVIIPPERLRDRWLANIEAGMKMRPISTRVNKHENDDGLLRAPGTRRGPGHRSDFSRLTCSWHHINAHMRNK
jgi:hypothetical protein